MALIVAFPYTGVAFAHTETMKMDEPGSVHPPGVCFTLFFIVSPTPAAPATSLLFFLFSFIRLLSALSLFNNVKKPGQLSHTRARPCPAPLAPGPARLPPAPGCPTGTRSREGSVTTTPPPRPPPAPSRALSRLRRQLSVKGRDAHLGFVIIY